MLLTFWMLRTMREYVIKKVKAPLHKVLILVGGRLPEPTKENTLHPNTHILLDIKDKFFEYEDNPNRKALLEAGWKYFIAEYEHDPYYRYRFDWLIEQIIESDWKPRAIGCPIVCWKEPQPYGGGYIYKGVDYDIRKGFKDKVISPSSNRI